MNDWIVIADAGGARIFAFQDRARPLTLVRELRHERSRAMSSAINTDRPGRIRSTSANRGSPATSHVGTKETEAERFATELATLLRQEHLAGAIRLLALFAPPHFLGLLLPRLDEGVRRSVVIAVHKGLTHLEPSQLTPHLGDTFSRLAAARLAADARRNP